MASHSVVQQARRLQRHARSQPALGLVLGSGFGGVLNRMRVEARVPFCSLPGFPRPTVPGHQGEWVMGTLAGRSLVVMSGRVHYYEGHPLEAVTRGVRVMAALGVRSLLLTNAAGGINARFRPGDFMLVTDHINLMGANPLRGPLARGQERFVDLTGSYDAEMRRQLIRAARQVRVKLQRGIYLAVSGPSYETPAEVRAFRRLGADAVGMSTVPEAMVARQLGLRVAALSCITNFAAGVSRGALSHQEVLETGREAAGRAARLLCEFIATHED